MYGVKDGMGGSAGNRRPSCILESLKTPGVAQDYHTSSRPQSPDAAQSTVSTALADFLCHLADLLALPHHEKS